MGYQRLKTNINGGFPLVLDDIRWLQGELSGPWVDYLESICPTNGAVWITGGKLDNDAVGISGGTVYIKGQGFFNVVTNPTALWLTTATFLRIDTTLYDGAGYKTFQDGIYHDTYELPQAEILGGTPISGDVIIDDWVYLSQKFNKSVGTLGTSVTEQGKGINVRATNDIVTIQFELAGPAGNQTTDYTVFDLAGDVFMPEYDVLFYVFDGNQAQIPMHMDSSGNLRARGDIVGFEFPIYGEVTYRIR